MAVVRDLQLSGWRLINCDVYPGTNFTTMIVIFLDVVVKNMIVLMVSIDKILTRFQRELLIWVYNNIVRK